MKENYSNVLDNIDNENNLKEEFFRYFSFWKWFILSTTIFIIAAFLILRYSTNIYLTTAKIEILDKAQDSEMSLPTSMTIFNRSMINLENEIGAMTSYNLHQNTVKSLNSNVRYFTIGNVKTSENHSSEWFSDYELFLKIDPDSIKNNSSYELFYKNNIIYIKHFNSIGDIVKEYRFNNLTTFQNDHKLPFDIKIKSRNESEIRKLQLSPSNSSIQYFMNTVAITKTGKNSDQLNISLRHSNRAIANEYINTLLSEFDKDGIEDRQLEYKRTMDFVDSRSEFLTKELEIIELRKQEFKEKNNLTDIKSDTNINVNQQFNYDSELFSTESQRDLVILLEESLNEQDFKLMPFNIGIENAGINQLISQYNLLVRERDRFLSSAGENNTLIKKLEKQLVDYNNNISKSIDNHKNSLEVTINNLKSKELQFENVFNNIPENEKLLRTIERELEIKEQLFLLLLQKREEAAINFAVVKPSIKIIDNARSNPNPVFPNSDLTYFISVFVGILLPFSILYLIFWLDTKIHTKEHLIKRVGNIPIVGEIPHITEKENIESILPYSSRSPLVESIRMVIANLNFVLFKDTTKNDKNNVILVTSSIKGEGKTIISVNAASVMSSKYDKVLLIGADLRNPQIHKFLGVDKTVKGLADYIYLENVDWKKYLIKHNKLDILISGTIPPNPTELLSSKKFGDLINEVKNIYDYIIIDSAPCLLVSDTFEISKYVNTTLYVVRSNFSDNKLCEFINECKHEKKLANINLVLNSIGSSRSYGYKYGYQYGYKYGYKYGYNYGYGYGYGYNYSYNYGYGYGYGGN